MDQHLPTAPPTTVREQLTQAAAPVLEHGAVVVTGFPSSGKSTAARVLAEHTGAVVLDKDRFAPMLENSVMQRLTGDESDRDSAMYHKVVAPGIYAGLVDAGLHVAQHHPVVLDAPFLSTLRAAAAAGTALGEFLRDHAEADKDLPIVTVWIDCPAEQIRHRMIARGLDRDRLKLTDWAGYQAGVLDSGVRELAHTLCDHIIES
ncbi:AAA family ATPase [Nocardia carnea]|uniref:AAA family ATPase n=1 Tax=Nocardia carnea TaxID=37328 RepID=UPI0003121332|nr:AAA family ATPase [Nocardia carnea]